MSLRQAATPWAVLLILAALAWVVTVQQARGVGVGTMGMALPFFLAMWVAMMSAMMFPSVAPIAILWTRSIAKRSAGWERGMRIASFVAGYLVAWTAYGGLAFAALIGTQRLVNASPDAAKWLGVGLFAAAGIYQLTPLKSACLKHCRSPMTQLLHYANFKGASRDVRVGIHHGLYCVGCCWGLMVTLVAVGVMNIAAMVALAAVIFIEKLWRRGDQFSRVVGVGFLAVAVLAAFYPSVLLPALHSGSGMASGGMGSIGMAG